MAEYELLLRDPRSLTLLGEVSRYDYAKWQRRWREGGSFELHVPRSAITASFAGVDDAGVLLEVRRDGAFEFAGMVTEYELRDPSFGRTRGGDTWAFKGSDLLGFFLSARIAEPDAMESQNGVPAETAIKHYVDRALGASADHARQVDTWLTNSRTFDLEADYGRGTNVYVDVLRKPLLPLVNDLLTQGDLMHSWGFQGVAPDGLTYLGYSYSISEPEDRTVASGALPFSVSWDNVAGLVFRQSGLSAHNCLYMLGDGSGDARTVTEVLAQNITPAVDARFTSAFRREDVWDARDQVSAGCLLCMGRGELLRRFDAAVTAEAEALISGSSPYRTAWDVGQKVTLSIPEVGIEIDRVVAEATVELKRGEGDVVNMALGDRPLTEQALQEKRWRRMLTAQVE